MAEGQGNDGSRAAVVEDEMEIIAGLLDVTGRRIADIGCGSGAFARRLATEGHAASVIGIDMPVALPERDETTPENLRFVPGGAQELPLMDGETDIAFMMKSLHHVPVESMDAALREIERVLVPGGILYVSEPVAAGRFNEIVRHFHDETEVREQAQRVLDRCTVLTREKDIDFLAPCRYRDFADFERRMIQSPTVTTAITDEIHAITRESYRRHASDDGSFFENRPFHVTVMRKPLS